jgi:hypothetical protein
MCANTEQIADNFYVSPSCGTKQCGLADGVPPVSVGPTLDQVADLLKITAPRCFVERRFGNTIVGGESSVPHEA